MAIDSAGIAVVSNRNLSDLPADSLSEKLVDIGKTEGAPEYQFFQASDGMVLRGGRIAVLNTGTQQLRFYDGQGRFLTSQGARGRGPGEYVAPYRLLPMAGDSLLVYDIGLGRFTVVDPSGGRRGRSFRPEPRSTRRRWRD